MLSKKTSKMVLTIGCDYIHPRGGIAQVMNTYSLYVFNPFRCIINSGGNNKIEKFWKAFTAYIKTFTLLLCDKRIQILHIHTASNNSFRRSAWWIKLAVFLKKKVVLHIHGGNFKTYYQSNPTWIKKRLDSCDAIIALNETWNTYFTKELQCQNVYIIENIIPSPHIYTINSTDTHFHLLFLGLITEEKGIFDLLEMIEINRSSLEQKIILHIGGLGKINKLQETIKQLKLESLVKYEGFVSGKHKEYLLNLSDAFILPSYIEGLPISILEAMSYGKPILTTPIGGIPEIIKENKNGYLFKPGDKTSMYNALCALLNHPQISYEMGLKNKEIAQNHLPKKIGTDLNNLYLELTKN